MRLRGDRIGGDARAEARCELLPDGLAVDEPCVSQTPGPDRMTVRRSFDMATSQDGGDLNPTLSALLISPPTWMLYALCAETDPESFFPEKGGSTKPAKAICEHCPVAAECIDFALDNDERFGIWGGLSERERRKVKRKLMSA